MTKGGIIEDVLREMRGARPRKRRRPAEEDKEEQDVIMHLEKLLRDAQPETEILTCADFIELNVECCTQCHWFMFPYDMCSVVKLKSGEYAWLCCVLGSAVKSASGAEISAKSKQLEKPAKSSGYKPFADFFGGSKVKDGE
jgi:hypothetical protein